MMLKAMVHPEEMQEKRALCLYRHKVPQRTKDSLDWVRDEIAEWVIDLVMNCGMEWVTDWVGRVIGWRNNQRSKKTEENKEVGKEVKEYKVEGCGKGKEPWKMDSQSSVDAKPCLVTTVITFIVNIETKANVDVTECYNLSSESIPLPTDT